MNELINKIIVNESLIEDMTEKFNNGEIEETFYYRKMNGLRKNQLNFLQELKKNITSEDAELISCIKLDSYGKINKDNFVKSIETTKEKTANPQKKSMLTILLNELKEHKEDFTTFAIKGTIKVISELLK